MFRTAWDMSISVGGLSRLEGEHEQSIKSEREREREREMESDRYNRCLQLRRGIVIVHVVADAGELLAAI